MKILAIETATEYCSVALWLDGELRERAASAPREHARRVLPWAEALLDEAGLVRADLDAIAVGCGPGAFTGVRLAVALGQGMALGLGVPLIAVSTLAALAWQAPAGRVLAVLDARMGELYCGAFIRGEDGIPRRLGDEWLAAPEAVCPPEAADWFGIGSGVGILAKLDRPPMWLLDFDATAWPSARAVATLAASGEWPAWAPEAVEPAYLRDRVALTLSEQRAARSGG